jgi:predicted choloylglycine hydrolase
MSDRSLSFSGSHKEIGHQVGELYKSWGKREAFVPVSADRYFDTQLSIYQKYFPSYLDYLAGVAEGMGVDTDTMIKMFGVCCEE